MAPSATHLPEGTSILVVDDDEVLRTRLARAFTARGFEARSAGDYEQALALAAEDPPEIAVVDLRMAGRSGLEVIRELHALEPAMRIVVLTGYGSIATAVEAMRLGAAAYLPKPADVEDLLEALARAEKPASGQVSAHPVPTLARAEWEHIQRVLTDCNGNVSEAARRLGIHRRSLQRKLGKYPPST